MTNGNRLLATLHRRGLVYQHTDGLDAHLMQRRSVYCGFDPTAPSLHVGNLVPVMALLRLAEAGHHVIALVGGGTALIGDPSGKSTERPLLGAADVVENGRAIGDQLHRVLGATVQLADNTEWLHALRAIDFLRDVGKHFPINQMLAKDTVRSRLESGISYTEFSYMLLQAYDFQQLHARYGVSIQVGGSDQWGNITAGTELIRRTAGGEAHALTTPLLTTSSGKKFGKTESGAVWLDPARTSPYAFYQFWMNSEDADAAGFLRLFTLLTDEEIAEIEVQHAHAPHLRLAQRTLAFDVTARVHSAADAERARAASDIVFARDPDVMAIGDDVFQTLASEVPHVQRTPDALSVAELLEAAFGISRSQARKVLQQGGVSVNGERLGAEVHAVPLTHAVRGRWMLLRKGAREVALVEITPA